MSTTKTRYYPPSTGKAPKQIKWGHTDYEYPKKRVEIDGKTYTLKTWHRFKCGLGDMIRTLRAQGYKHIRVLPGSKKVQKFNHEMVYLVYVRRTH